MPKVLGNPCCGPVLFRAPGLSLEQKIWKEGKAGTQGPLRAAKDSGKSASVARALFTFIPAWRIAG